MNVQLDRPTSRRSIVALGIGLGLGATAVRRPSLRAQVVPDLGSIQSYTIDRLDGIVRTTTRLREAAESYATGIHHLGGSYEEAAERHSTTLLRLVDIAKAEWITANDAYEQVESLLVGDPELARHHSLIDTSASAAESPDTALDWALALPDGRTLEQPGNLFHHLTEPTLWGTVDAFVGHRVDRTGDVFPDADVLLASTVALDDAVRDARSRLDAWRPSLQSALTSLTTMTPSVASFFEQWKRSAFVADGGSVSASFVAVSRLSDAAGMLNGLDVIYRSIAPAISEASPSAETDIYGELASLSAYVADLARQERSGTIFTAYEADVFGREAQRMATEFGSQLTEVAERLGVSTEPLVSVPS